MNLIIPPNRNVKNLGEFIDYWQNQYYTYTNVSDSIYNFCITSLKNNTDTHKSICLIGAWKTNSISLYSNPGDIAFSCPCGKKYYFTGMWKSGTSSAHDIWVGLSKDYNRHKSLLSTPHSLISELESKTYNGARSPNTIFGLTYSLTYLHFLDPNGFPIFDKFVFLAVNFINSMETPDIPYKNNKSCRSFDDYIDNYVNKFNIIQKSLGKDNRCVDKALWSFGHYISNSRQIIKPVCCKI